MALLSFEQLHAEVAAFHAAEAAKNTPAAVVRRALDTLHDVLDQLADDERAEVVAELAGIIDDETDRQWSAFGAAFAMIGDG